MTLSRLALTLALLPTLPALAETPSQDDALKLDELLVTANRSVEARSQSSAASTVFTRADIERLQARSVAEILQYVPGVNIVSTGGAGSQTGIFMRGTSTAQTLVLVDGQRIASASSGTASIEFLSPDQIERIEVVRGSRSALYGSDAIGGVIQIFTRRGETEGIHPYVRLAAGSRGTFERSAGVSGGDGRTRYQLGAALDETAGIDATTDELDGNRDHDAYRNRSLSLSLSHRFNERLEVGATLLDQRGKNEFDDVFGDTRPYNDFVLSSGSAYIDGTLSERWSSRLEVGHSEDKRDTRNDVANGSFYTYNTFRDSANWVNTLQLNEANQLLVGADWYEERLHATDAFIEGTRWNQGLFIQHRLQTGRFSTELGLRHDKNAQYGSENTWNGALTVPLNQANALTLSYSEGFRAPTFNDLYYPDFCSGGFCFPSANPDLKPERSKSYELQWRSDYSTSGHLDVSVYRTQLEDAIVLDENFIPQNVQNARINGFEASLDDQLFGWQANLALGLTDPRDRDSGHVLPRRVKRTLSLALDRRFGDFGIGATWRAVSGVYDDAANDIALGGYGLLGLRGDWQATSEVNLALKLDNLLDKDYAQGTYQGGLYPYRSEGRTALMALTWTPEI
ncbi:TonB-dependent receptor [Pseudomonas kuykendallii]|uniref:Vitamin B12 transporter n=1 Tax=Pseudomonas kuykendallii TaxID=1007099 RepID=A0A1H2V272_9PSED|nr:TonB-dependent receptor [Pseudomonas kuykendallii]MCQ4271339.1 TonB-dependent receptor [Pseudomonas kuykendallii]SDW62380.1 vitamin B12 transporter [Pseudomonas kuykendallii]